MIKIPQGFKIASKEVVDTRLVMSKTEMLTVSDAVMPEVYFTLCSDDNTMYIYNKQNTIDEICGKFRPYANSSSVNPSEIITIEQIQGLFQKEGD